MKPNWFVALPVAAESWLQPVLAHIPDSCRAFQPEDVHLTVAFLGHLAEPRQRAVREVLERVEGGPFRIGLGPLLALPSKKRVSALSFSVESGRQPVCDFMARWRDPLIEAAAARSDHRPPLAHITVARPLRKAGFHGRQEALVWARNVVPPKTELVLNRIALYTWADDRRVRQFQIVWEKPLSQ